MIKSFYITEELMITNSKIIALAVIVIFVFGVVYAGVGVEDAAADKAKKGHKETAKVKKGLLAQKLKEYKSFR